MYVLDKLSDTYEAIFASDIVISLYSSSTVLEAMVMGKPTIIADLTNDREAIPYVESGAAIGVFNAEDLGPAIQKLLFDEEDKNHNEAQRNRFLSEQIYKCDGLASARLIDLVIELIEDQRGDKKGKGEP